MTIMPMKSPIITTDPLPHFNQTAQIMKNLFSRKNKPVYADHLSDLEGIEHPYFPRKTVHSDQPASNRLPDNHRRPDHYGPARTTLDALQIIRRRFEEQTNNQSDEDQAAA